MGSKVRTHIVPAAAAVFYAPIKECKSLVFVSSEKSEHIVNSSGDNSCAATIQQDGLKWTAIKGLQIKGKIAIVTGGARGIGGATARNFAKNVDTVVIADIDEDAANNNVIKINRWGPN